MSAANASAPARVPAAVLRARRLPLLALGFASLVAGVIAGLARLGLDVPLPHGDVAPLHGPLMVSGFFGTVIGLERAAALGRRWVFAGPLASGLGGLALAWGAPVPEEAGLALLALGAAVLLAASVRVWRQQPAGFTATMALGAACWLVGGLLWLAGVQPDGVVPWWMLFLILTVAGERLELSRFRPPNRWAGPAFAGIVAVLLTGAVTAAAVDADQGFRVAGVGLLGLAAWLARFDVARNTVRGQGLPRYVAVCLLSGYAWLAVAGALALSDAEPASGEFYDPILHAVFLGFVFSMVFGHAPIILPAVLRLAVPFGRVLYLPVAVLHLGVAVRVAGVLAESLAARRLGAEMSAAAIALFIALTAWSVLRRR